MQKSSETRNAHFRDFLSLNITWSKGLPKLEFAQRHATARRRLARAPVTSSVVLCAQKKGALSRAAFDAALVEVVGAQKVERAMHHVLSLSDAHSDAPTVQATTTPPRLSGR